MHTVKVFLGFIELAAALKFFSNADLALFGEKFVISRQLFLLTWAVIFLLSGAYQVNLPKFWRETHENFLFKWHMQFGHVVRSCSLSMHITKVMPV